MATDSLRAQLQAAFPDAEVSVEDRTGGGDHFQVIVASSAFNGLSLIEQHKLVNAALAGPLADAFGITAVLWGSAGVAILVSVFQLSWRDVRSPKDMGPQAPMEPRPAAGSSDG